MSKLDVSTAQASFREHCVQLRNDFMEFWADEWADADPLERERRVKEVSDASEKLSALDEALLMADKADAVQKTEEHLELVENQRTPTRKLRNKGLRRMLSVRGPQQSPALKKPGAFLVAVRDDQHHKQQYRVHRPELYERDEFNQLSLIGDTGEDGGFAVFDEMRDEIYALVVDEGEFSGLCYTFPMMSESIKIPALKQSEAPAPGASAQFAGMMANFVGNTESGPETQPEFRQVEFFARMMEHKVRLANTLVSDAAGSGILLDALVFDSPNFGIIPVMRSTLNHRIIHGTGNFEPEGIINSTAVVETTRDIADKISVEDLARMMSRSMGRGAWVFHPFAFTELVDLRKSTDQSALIWGENTLADSRPGRLLGSPLIFSHWAPKSGRGSMMYIDFNEYWLALRQDFYLDASTEVYFEQRETLYRGTMRVDGKPMLDAPYTLPSGATDKISPFVLSNQ